MNSWRLYLAKEQGGEVTNGLENNFKREISLKLCTKAHWYLISINYLVYKKVARFVRKSK